MKLSIRLVLLGFTLLCLSIAGCGFKLRGAQPLPAGINQIHVVSAQAHLPLARALERQLNLYQIPLVKSVTQQTKAETLTIYLEPDSLDRRLLSLFASGQVAEYELILSIRYKIAFPDQNMQTIEFDVNREYQDDPNAILAKSRELQLVLTEMRENAADRIIRLMQSQAGTTD